MTFSPVGLNMSKNISKKYANTQTQVVAGQSTFVIENGSKPVRSFQKGQFNSKTGNEMGRFMVFWEAKLWDSHGCD